MRLWELFGSEPIDEALDKPVDWFWVIKSKRNWMARFTVGEVDYDVIFAGEDGDEVTLSFSTDGSEEITGTGGSFAVFATVGDILKDFLRQRKPKWLSFTAKEPSRAKLYKRLATMVAKETNGVARPYKDDRWGDGYRIALESALHEEGKIVPGVNTTVDVQPGETQRQAAKFGNIVDAKSRPPLLRGSYGDDSAYTGVSEQDPFYGPDGTRLKRK